MDVIEQVFPTVLDKMLHTVPQSEKVRTLLSYDHFKLHDKKITEIFIVLFISSLLVNLAT